VSDAFNPEEYRRAKGEHADHSGKQSLWWQTQGLAGGDW
jgi:hypothetical protein